MDDHTTLADLVTATPAAGRVLEQHQLDYCCGGQRTVADACAHAGIDLDTLLIQLDALAPGPEPDWATMNATELVDHIEATHHAYLHRELAPLSALSEKVLAVHGERHSELVAVAETYAELRADLEPHLAREERVLFPMIRELAVADQPPAFHCGSLANPIRVMLAEHDRAGELLARLRSLSHGYEPPEDGCASYQSLYARLAELEADTHLHVHKENNVLFPAVMALERRFAVG